MISPHPVDRVIERETFREIIEQLEPEELIIGALRLEGLSDTKVGEILGLTKVAVRCRMQQACERISKQCPHLAPILRDRLPYRANRVCRQIPPLEFGYLCHWDSEMDDPFADMTTGEAARYLDVSRQTIARWVRAGRFPNAYRVSGMRKGYRIPRRDLDRAFAGFQRPRKIIHKSTDHSSTKKPCPATGLDGYA